MVHGFSFSELVFLLTLVFAYSTSSTFHIFQCQGSILFVCGAQPSKRTVTWLLPDRAIKGKSQKRLERHIWTFNWSSETNFKTVPFQLAWFRWLFDASLVSRFIFWSGNPGCALIQPHTCACNMRIISSFVINWQFRRIDHNGSHKPVSVLSPQ